MRLLQMSFMPDCAARMDCGRRSRILRNPRLQIGKIFLYEFVNLLMPDITGNGNYGIAGIVMVFEKLLHIAALNSCNGFLCP